MVRRVYEKTFEFVKTGWRPITWTVSLYKPKSAILKIHAKAVDDRFARVFILKVNGTQITRKVIVSQYLDTINISKYVKDGNNKIEFIITTRGKWVLTARLETEEEERFIPFITPLEDLFKSIFQGMTLTPEETAAYATATLVPVAPLVILGAQVAYEAYKEYKKREKK